MSFHSSPGALFRHFICLGIAVLQPAFAQAPDSGGTPIADAPKNAFETAFGADLPDRIAKNSESIEFTLPNGRKVVGKIERLHQADFGIDQLEGRLQHPEAGMFEFSRTANGELKGRLGFDSQPTIWRIAPASEAKQFRWVESPAEDAFRPRKMVMPTAKNTAKAATEITREQAETTLRESLKIEEIAPGKFRIGQVEFEKNSRVIRFPAKVNMHSGTVEYGVVTATGKCHEALFSTVAAPQDIHLAMLLLGIKPASMREDETKGLIVPPDAAVSVKAEWTVNGEILSHPLADLVTVAKTSSEMRATAGAKPAWLYNGSRFNDAGFAAALDGSIISLIADDMALINNAGRNRVNDDAHLPNSDLLPATGTDATILISLSGPP